MLKIVENNNTKKSYVNINIVDLERVFNIYYINCLSLIYIQLFLIIPNILTLFSQLSEYHKKKKITIKTALKYIIYTIV